MDINIFLLKCRVKIYNKTLQASRAKRLNKVLINIRKMFSFVLFHNVETSLLARSNSLQSDPLPGNCFTHGDLLNDGCNEPINGENIFRIVPDT